MTITYKGNEMYIDGKRVIWPRDDNFNHGAVLFGLDYTTGTFVPINADSSGSLLSADAASSNWLEKNQGYTASGPVLTGSYQQITFGFLSKGLTLSNDGAEVIEFSWDGVALAGVVKGNESFKLEPVAKESIYLKTVSGNACNYRLMAW